MIGLLTILGFSLYDTVVVFDKVRENTRGLLGLTRRTYGEAANLALNQTLMRSINTALIALLPILGLLIVGYVLLGSGTLQDLALVQLTGTLVGVLSSVALATPLLVDFKMRDPKYQQQAERVRQRRVAQERKTAGRRRLRRLGRRRPGEGTAQGEGVRGRGQRARPDPEAAPGRQARRASGSADVAAATTPSA